MDSLIKWGKWKRNLVYWGFGREFNTRVDPRGRKVLVNEYDYLIVEEVDLIFRSYVKSKSSKKAMKVLVDFYVFEWSIKKMAEVRRISEERVLKLKAQGEELISGRE